MWHGLKPTVIMQISGRHGRAHSESENINSITLTIRDRAVSAIIYGARAFKRCAYNVAHAQYRIVQLSINYVVYAVD